MKDLKDFLDNVFLAYQDEDYVVELKKEMYSNLLDRYEDYIRQGFNSDQAFGKTVRDFGKIDPEELGLEDYLRKDDLTREDSLKSPKKATILKSFSIGTFIVAATSYDMLEKTFSPALATSIFGILISLALGLMIYSKFFKVNDKSDPKEPEESEEDNDLYRSLNTSLWLITIAIYIFSGMVYKIWHLNWLLFLLALALNPFIKIFSQKHKGN